jgi:hypothetical protein
MTTKAEIMCIYYCRLVLVAFIRAVPIDLKWYQAMHTVLHMDQYFQAFSGRESD